MLESHAGSPHPLSLLLVAWRLRGDASQSKVFCIQWSTYSWRGRDSPQDRLTSPPGSIGSVGTFLERRRDSLSADLNPMLECLTDLHIAGYSYSQFNLHRSMLSSTLEQAGAIPVGQLPSVKAAFNCNPPRPRYDQTWDVCKVIDLIASSALTMV